MSQIISKNKKKSIGFEDWDELNQAAKESRTQPLSFVELMLMDEQPKRDMRKVSAKEQRLRLNAVMKMRRLSNLIAHKSWRSIIARRALRIKHFRTPRSIRKPSFSRAANGDSGGGGGDSGDPDQPEPPSKAARPFELQRFASASVFKLQIDTTAYPSKQAVNAAIGTIKKRLQGSQGTVKSVTANELLESLLCGRTVSPGILIGSQKSSSWQEQQIFMLDIDNDKPPFLTVEEAIKLCSEKKIPLLAWYESFTNTIERPKFRLVFATEQPVFDIATRNRFMIWLIGSFAPYCDSACKDASRLFFGTNGKGEIVDGTARISIDGVTDADGSNVLITSSEHAKTDDLKTIVRDFDFLSLLEQENGRSTDHGEYRTFANCAICGHSDCLRYYHKTKTAFCFGRNGQAGGDVIEYLSHSRNLTKSQAIHELKHVILGLPEPTRGERLSHVLQRTNPTDGSLQDVLEELKPHESYKNDALGFAELFADVFRDSLRYNVTARCWLAYEDSTGLWKPDIGEVVAMACLLKLIAELTQYCATKIDDIAVAGTLIETLGSTYRRLNVREVILRDSQKMLAVRAEGLDGHDNLLCVKNGVYDLKNMEFKPHSPSYLLTKSANVTYDPDAKCPRWERFISEIMSYDNGKEDYLQRLFGYGLTADTSLEQLYILYGSSTRNGKSTLMEVITYMLKDYAVTASSSTFELQKTDDTRRASGDIARLAGCRIVHASEPSKRMIFDVARLKTLTGGDSITARHLHEREFEFRPKFKLILNTNFLPLITDSTLFTSGRVVVIPFERHFDETEQDRTLKQVLKQPESLSAILNWCLVGLRKFKEENLFMSSSIKEATLAYERKSDKVGSFIEAYLIREPSVNTKMKDVYICYKQWCEENGYGVENCGNFSEDMKTKGLWSKSGTVGGITYQNVVRGYRIKTVYE